MIGRVVGNYEIVERIGEGGMGTVWRARDVMLEREVAVKAIRPDLAREPQIVERFRSEARTIARVNHPAITTIYSYFKDGEEWFIAMELVRGRSLAEVVRSEGALPWPRAVVLMAAVLDGVEQVHRLGIVHRDLKPDNLMLTDAGGIKVMDFGIARVAGSGHLTRTGLLVGTLRYMAPEQIRGEEVDRRTDVYALGTVLYEMLTARVPFTGESDYAVLKAHLEVPPAPPRTLMPDLPEWLDRAVLRALAKEPADRFQTAEELRTFLLEARLADQPTVLVPPLEGAGAPRPGSAPAAVSPGTAPPPGYAAAHSPGAAPGSGSAAPARAPSAAAGSGVPDPLAGVPTIAGATRPTPSTRATPRAQMSGPISGPAGATAAGGSYRAMSVGSAERRGRPLLWGLAAAVLLVVVGYAGWSLRGRTGGDEQQPVAISVGAQSTGTPSSSPAPGAAQGADPLAGVSAGAVPSASSDTRVTSSKAPGNADSGIPASGTPPSGVANSNPVTARRAEESGVSRPTRGSAPPSRPQTGRPLPLPAPGEPASQAPGTGTPPAAEAVPPQTPQVEPTAPATPFQTEPERPAVGTVAELARLATELVQATDRLAEAYEQHIEQKEDGGAELTPGDERLGSEIEAMQESAARFQGRLHDGRLARARSRLRREDDAARKADFQRRLRDLIQAAGRVERLMGEVQPSAPLLDAWRDVRDRGRQIVEAAPRGPGGGGPPR